MIRRISEGETCWLPGILTSDLPSALPAGVTVHIKNGTIGLESQGVVGAFPLKNGDTVQIEPKIGDVNFLKLLFRAEGSQRTLESEFDEFVELSVVDNANMNSIVARQLLKSLDEILRRSPIQGRIRLLSAGDYATGEIDPLKTAMRIATGKSRPVVSRLKRRTADVAENRVLTEALVRAWEILSDEPKSLYARIRESWLNRFERSKDIWSDLLAVESEFSQTGYGGSRDYYRRALMLAKIILGSSGVGFSGGNQIHGDAVLLNAADIFEKYVRSVVRDAYAEKGFVVTKGGVGVHSLYTDGSFELLPDVVISKNGATCLIADAKYKKPTASDHYQMSSYLAAHNLKRGVLIAPLFSGASVVIKEYSTPNKLVVRELFLPMNDLDATEEALSSLVEDFSN
jgi:5-methylcytosine-specific restriction enzyme subunit McrC